MNIIQIFRYYIRYLRFFTLAHFWRIIKCHLFYDIGILQLKKIFICMSHECNANCVHCYEKFKSNKLSECLTSQQAKNIIDQFYELGGYQIFFCSGEFLLREDALELIQFASSKSISTAVVTNGIILNEKKIIELKTAGLNFLIVSIDSADPSRHDYLRGVPGCFKKAVEGIRIAAKKGLPSIIWAYVSKSNFNELSGIAGLAEKIGVKNIFTFFPLLSGNFFDKPEENLTFEEREFFRRKFNGSSNVTLEFTSEKSLCRGGGRIHICVMPSGDVTFCPPVPYSYGNIASKSLKDCLKEIRKDYKRFCFSSCRGQCIVNFTEYRNNCNATFMY